jgi:hypothetical protein
MSEPIDAVGEPAVSSDPHAQPTGAPVEASAAPAAAEPIDAKAPTPEAAAPEPAAIAPEPGHHAPEATAGPSGEPAAPARAPAPASSVEPGASAPIGEPAPAPEAMTPAASEVGPPASTAPEPTALAEPTVAPEPTVVPEPTAAPEAAAPEAAAPEPAAPDAAAPEAVAASEAAAAPETTAPAAEPEPPPPPEPEPPPPPPPTIRTFQPDHGPLSGGTTLRIAGDGFAEGCLVSLGGVASTVVRESAASLRVETPAGAIRGHVDLRVENPDGQAETIGDAFRYDPPPTITGVEPAHVSTLGGTVLTILGTELAVGCAVHVAGKAVPAARAHGGRLEAVVQAHAAGEVDLVVQNPDGQRVRRERALVFADPPVLRGVEPAEDLTVGGAEVHLHGESFERGCVVLFAGSPIEAVTYVSATELSVTAPAHAAVEAVDVSVVNPTGLAARLLRGFTFTKAAPRVVSLSPLSGFNQGGTRLTLQGRDFDEGAAVFVCGIAAQVIWKSAQELEVVTPAVARDGLVDVRVVNLDDQAHVVEKAFRYDAPLPPPVLTSVSPGKGSQLGGLTVALLGDDFAEGVTARFGGVAAAVRFLTRKQLEATVPASTATGEVAVEVKNPDGVSAVLEAAFVYEARPAPAITSASVSNGPTIGGTRIVLEGVNFTRECQVYVGREPPKDQVVKSATEIHIVTAPRKTAGVVDVEVAAPGVPKAVLKNGFRYDAVPAPLITSVSPNAGTPGGGTELTISGKNFLKDSAVLIDGKAPRTVKLVDAQTLELKMPPGDAGKMVDVIVRNPDGKEAVQKRAFLYDPRYRG